MKGSRMLGLIGVRGRVICSFNWLVSQRTPEQMKAKQTAGPNFKYMILRYEVVVNFQIRMDNPKLPFAN